MQNINSCAFCDRTKTITLFGKELQVKNYICSQDGIHYRQKPEDAKLQLSICPTSYCNASCPFCIAKNTKTKDVIDLRMYLYLMKLSILFLIFWDWTVKFQLPRMERI